MSACADCRKPTGRPLARYCDGCRWKHRGKRRMYVWTPERDAILHERYTGRKGVADALSASFGWPKWVIKRRAGELGLTQPRARRDWTPEEEAFLLAHAGERHVNWIAKRLGRSWASVVMKLKHEHMSRAVREGYTMRELELCFGVDHRRIERWLQDGKLHGTRRHGNGGPTDAWVVTEEAVCRFVVEHPAVFRLDRVDQRWFMGLVTDGLLKPLRRPGHRAEDAA